MTPKQSQKNGALFVWSWDDKSLEAPNQLKNTLDAIIEQGFAGVLARLKGTRYSLVHPRVVRAVTQVSLWSKSRGLPFWFQADPRQASRPLTNNSEETSQVLFYNNVASDSKDSAKVNVCKIKENTFNLYFEYPQFRKTSKLDDRALIFIPRALEKAFMFKMKKGIIQKNTIRDISSSTNFFVNIPESRIEVFGHINTLGEEDWNVIAFPKFDVNSFDYAGRASNDALYNFLEDLFDAGAYIDGITWDTAGYIVDIGRLPVSISIYHSFMAEFGYDVRDFLYTLVLDVDDQSHIPIRHNYHDLLMKVVYSAFKEFTKVGKGFLGNIESATSHSWSFRSHPSLSLIQGDMDPWEGLKSSSVGMTEMSLKDSLTQQLPLIISQLVATKSLATYSKSNSAYLHLKMNILDEWKYLFDLMAFYSIKPFIDSGQIQINGSIFEFENNFDISIEYIHQRLESIQNITEFHIPSANVAIVYPIDTIMAVGHDKADQIIHNFHHCVAKLSILGIQLDILSPGNLLKGKIKNDLLNIGHRQYSHLLYPYPNILKTDILNAISVFNSKGFITLFGGSSPQFNTTGKRIPHNYPVHFDPVNFDIPQLKALKLTGLVAGLKNGIANIIHLGNKQLILMLPVEPGGKMSGTVTYENVQIPLKETSTLTIYEVDLKDNVKKLF